MTLLKEGWNLKPGRFFRNSGPWPLSQAFLLNLHFLVVEYVRFQLDLIRGELTSNPDTRKYIPVYMSFNSTKKDIPDFLSSRVSHSLPEEIDRVVFHLLNIERIQPRRRRMVAVIGGNDHPYDEAKGLFEAAIDEAARYHWESRRPSNRISDERIELGMM